MIKTFNVKLLVFYISLILLTPAISLADAFQVLSHQIMEELQSFYPVRSTEMGIHSYDHRFTDYSSSSVKKMIGKLNRFEKKLYKYRGAKLSAHNKINYKLLKSNVDIALQDLKKIRWHKKSPQLYVDEAVNGLYFLVLSPHAPMSEKIATILVRMRAVPKLFATARKNLKKPPQIYIDAAIKSLEDGIGFYKDVAGDISKQHPERADQLMKYSTRAREAMNDFMNFLSTMTAGSEKSFAIGKNNFDYKLKNEYFLKYDSDSLLKIGQTLLKQAQDNYRKYAGYVGSNRQSGNHAVFVPATFASSDILDYYNWETNQVKLFCEENQIVSVPEDIGQVTVLETPAFLRSMHAGISYQPAGPFDTAQHGYFYVRPIPNIDDPGFLSGRYQYVHRRGFKGSVVHEAFPGHHLQLQLARMNNDPLRKTQFNIMMIEGWALYCEQMMYEEGLFGQENAAQWLAVLGDIRFRAARIVADISLHTGRMSYNECVDWMIEVLELETESEKKYIQTEVRRYTVSPTYQMSYLIGKQEILKLRQAMMKKEGDNFSLRRFHDALLAEGSIAPALMWQVMGLKKP